MNHEPYTIIYYTCIDLVENLKVSLPEAAMTRWEWTCLHNWWNKTFLQSSVDIFRIVVRRITQAKRTSWQRNGDIEFHVNPSTNRVNGKSVVSQGRHEEVKRRKNRKHKELNIKELERYGRNETGRSMTFDRSGICDPSGAKAPDSITGWSKHTRPLPRSHEVAILQGC